jgi:Cdc6-like AAA superfamily ATPase
MTQTLFTRLSDETQYDSINRIVLWRDSTESRWKNLYSRLNQYDQFIFILRGKILLGIFDENINNQILRLINVREFKIENDDFLRIRSLIPEKLSQLKANFNAFIAPMEINFDDLVFDIENKNYISFYIINSMERVKLAPILHENDRVVIVDKNKIRWIHKFINNDYSNFNGLSNEMFGAKDKSLVEIKKIHADSGKSYNLASIDRIINGLNNSGFYKFNSFSEYYNIIHNKFIYKGMKDDEESDLNQVENKMPPDLNQILYGPPGTGKTYHTINKALEIIGEKDLANKTRKEIKYLFDKRMKEGQIVFTTFHQSMSYEDFIEGIKPLKPDESEGIIKYDVVDGVFKVLCKKAETPENLSFENAYMKLLLDLEGKDEIEVRNANFSYKIKSSENGEDLRVLSDRNLKNITKVGLAYVSKSHRYLGTWGKHYKALFQLLKENYGYTESVNSELKNHVLIIDEINRGNVSSIFGELITLIEEDKRLGKDESLEVTLPYSKAKFGVPSNLYIIGTMNTADRSVEALDTALRRRFCFEEVPPKYDLEELKYDYAGVKGFEILQTLNKRIEKLLDKDHQIGHFYLMMRNGNNVYEKLLTSFYKNIIPLLQEYFFGDFGKIGLVLGKGFVKVKDWDKNSDSFADFDYQSASEFDDTEVFEIIDYRKSDTNYSIQIKDKLVKLDFQNAIKLLMKQDIE